MTRIIGIAGRKQSGKDTVATTMMKYYTQRGYTAKRYSFAGPLKEHCQKFFGLTQQQCYGTDEEKNTPTELLWEDFPVAIPEKSGVMTGREVLQYVGTEIIRKTSPMAHVRAIFTEIEQDAFDYAFLVDCRFPNEVFSILERQGKVIRLTRALYAEDEHASEKSLDGDVFDWHYFSAVLDNTRMTLEEQHWKVQRLCALWHCDKVRHSVLLPPRAAYTISLDGKILEGYILEERENDTLLMKRDRSMQGNLGISQIDLIARSQLVEE